jgi:crotonobetaine/carnitine-CoA ligase
VTAAAPQWTPALATSAIGAPDIVRLTADACARHPDVPILVFEDGVSVTRAEFLARIEQFAGWLRTRIEPGDRVAIMLDNRTEFMIAWLAVAAAGGMLVSMNVTAGEYDATHVLRDSEARVAIIGEGVEALFASLASVCPDLADVIVVRGPEPRGLAVYGDPAQRLDLATADIDPAAITNVYYTSGTTGPPKGCMLAHDYWLRFADLYLRLYGLAPEDRLLCCLHFFYGDPPWQLLASLHAGSTLVVMRRFSVSRFWDVVDRHAVTRVFGLASIPSLLLKAPPGDRDRDHAVDFALQIGVPTNLHAELVARWGFPWVEGYGLTETGLVVGMPLEHADEMTGSGSIGLPCPGVDARVVDDELVDVADGEPGELLIRAPGLMRGYLNRPDATADTLRHGWLHTGDLARRDARVFLYFLGRKKDIIRRSGENVAAAEVEQLLRSHPSVLEAAVVAVPDDLRGEEVKAYVALIDGARQADLPPEEIVRFCADRLARYKVPRFLQYRQELPRTPSMRVKKSELLQETTDLRAGAWDREQTLGW